MLEGTFKTFQTNIPYSVPQTWDNFILTISLDTINKSVVFIGLKWLPNFIIY